MIIFIIFVVLIFLIIKDAHHSNRMNALEKEFDILCMKNDEKRSEARRYLSAKKQKVKDENI